VSHARRAVHSSLSCEQIDQAAQVKAKRTIHEQQSIGHEGHMNT
jgi:hypothetical protein